eukprot:TRINITY_DN4575_c0_g1_i1.p1 TRINITY_DN4575_c0_g1~~TRINITY_DN4575_c0_g1_i1.p1  ORF type:complete len:290 (-),score=68.47 TRINITY_DN4575_c0_g1_i1:83-952(-)
MIARLLFLISIIYANVMCMEHKAVEGSDEWREAININSIKQIEFIKGQFTSGRRLPGVPQLECIGGSAQGFHEPISVKCINIGALEPKWRCEANLDKSVELNTVVVQCEGYSDEKDPYVLKNSCALRYSLNHSSWMAFFYGWAIRLIRTVILTPLKWILGFLATAFVIFVVVAAIRKPNSKKSSSKSNPSIRSKRFKAPQPRSEPEPEPESVDYSESSSGQEEDEEDSEEMEYNDYGQSSEEADEEEYEEEEQNPQRVNRNNTNKVSYDYKQTTTTTSRRPYSGRVYNQ